MTTTARRISTAEQAQHETKRRGSGARGNEARTRTAHADPPAAAEGMVSTEGPLQLSMKMPRLASQCFARPIPSEVADGGCGGIDGIVSLPAQRMPGHVYRRCLWDRLSAARSERGRP